LRDHREEEKQLIIVYSMRAHTSSYVVKTPGPLSYVKLVYKYLKNVQVRVVVYDVEIVLNLNTDIQFLFYISG
jgi:hypothetical protein